MAKTDQKILDRVKAHYAANRAEKCKRQREYYERTKEERKAYAAQYRNANREQLRVDQKDYRAKYRSVKRELWNQRSRECQQRLRVEVLKHYGGKCACCGEAANQFLAIDHVSGGGGKHRSEVGRGAKFYMWLKRNGFPGGFRILCHNCNMARGLYGECPHESVVRVAIRRGLMEAV